MEPNKNYKIFNEEIEFKLKELSDALGGSLPPNWGFTLLLYDFNAGASGSLFYASNGNREDIIKMMKEFIALDTKEKHAQKN
jgi:hypothetical protein